MMYMCSKVRGLVIYRNILLIDSRCASCVLLGRAEGNVRIFGGLPGCLNLSGRREESALTKCRCWSTSMQRVLNTQYYMISCATSQM